MVVETIVTAGAVMATSEALKRALKLPSNIMPLLSIGLGLLIGGLYSFAGDQLLVDGLAAGFIAGLTASGGYDVITKTAREN